MSPVVVGVDDSEESLRAVEWAAGEAGRRRRPLRILHAAERVLATALARARTVAPGVDVTAGLPESEPVNALLHSSREAELLVVGSRGLGEVGGLLLGSVGARLAAEAACPIVVVRGPFPSYGPVVVGVAGHGEGETLLPFAFAYAARTANTLVLAHAGAEEPVRAERWQERFPSVTVVRESLTGHPAQALTHTAGQASLLVVGSHHRHELSALLHGSVSQNALHHAPCPVAIIRIP